MRDLTNSLNNYPLRPKMSIFVLMRWTESQDAAAHKPVVDLIRRLLDHTERASHRRFEHFHAAWECVTRVLRSAPVTLREHYRTSNHDHLLGTAPALAKSVASDGGDESDGGGEFDSGSVSPPASAASKPGRPPNQRLVWMAHIPSGSDLLVLPHPKAKCEFLTTDVTAAAPEVKKASVPLLYCGKPNEDAVDVFCITPARLHGPAGAPRPSAAAAAAASGAAAAGAAAPAQGLQTLISVQLKFSEADAKGRKATTNSALLHRSFHQWLERRTKLSTAFSK